MNIQKPVIISQNVLVVMLFCITAIETERLWGDDILTLSLYIPIAMTVSATILFISKQKIQISIADIIVAVWWTAEAIIAYCGLGIITDTAFIEFTKIILLYISLRLLFCIGKVDEQIIVRCILATCLYQCLLGFMQIVTGTSRHAMFAVTGTFLNPGIYAAFIAIGITTGITYLYQVKKEKNRPGHLDIINKNNISALLSYSTIIAGILLLPATWSRTAVIAVAVTLIIIYKEKCAKHIKLLLPAIIFIFTILYFIKANSALGRVLIWNISCNAITDSPIIGHGIGSFSTTYGMARTEFFSESPNSTLLSLADVTYNAFNEILTLGVEQGIVGVTCCLAVLFCVVRSLQKNSRVLKYPALTLLTLTLFSYPLHIQANQIILIAIGAWAVTTNSQMALNIPPKKMLLPELLIMFICIINTKEIITRIRYNKEYQEIAHIEPQYVITDYYNLQPYCADNPNFIFSFAKGLSAQQRYNDSNAMLRQGLRISNDPMFLICMGNNYHKLKLTKHAEQCYINAHKSLPNRIYPKYKLMKLYEETGNDIMKKKIAEDIMSAEVKIESQATRQMRQEAHTILESL